MRNRYILFFSSIIAASSYGFGQSQSCELNQGYIANDSVKNQNQDLDGSIGLDSVHELNEVVVKSNSVLRKGNLIEVYPTKRDRRFASGAIDVLANMHLPEVLVNPMNNEVTFSDGQAIAMFIDFQPASSQQLQDVRPQDIQRIDIIRSPADPRFQGAKVVANYIMKKYEYGGYTKMGVSQFFPVFTGNYDLYSKFSFKKMSYDISTGLRYVRHGNNTGTDESSIYKFGNTEINRVSKTDSYLSRQLVPRVSARVAYNSPGVSIANTVGFNFFRFKPTEMAGTVYSSNMDEPSESHSVSSRYNKSVVWQGNYYFMLRNAWSLSFNGTFDWGDNSDHSSYVLSGNAPIVNNISESILNASGGFTLSKKLQNHNLSIYCAGGWNRNSLMYHSSDNTSVYHREGYGQIGGQVNLNFNGFSVSPSVRVSLSSEKLNERTYSQLYPKSFVPFYVQLTKVSSISGSFEFAIGDPSAALRSPVLVQTNEIDAVRGNENLSSYRYYNARVGYSYYWGSWLSTRFDALFNCEDNVLTPVYNPTYSQGGFPIMVRDVVNDGSVCNAAIRASLSGNYFNNRLSMNVSGILGHFSQHGNRSVNKWAPGCWLSASYYLGNFRINAYFTPSAWQYSAWRDTKTPLFWFVGASYSYDDLFVDLRLSNPFEKSYVDAWRKFDSENYSFQQTSYSPDYHQFVKVTLSYSFGYGKKMNRQDEVNMIDGSESVILRNN